MAQIAVVKSGPLLSRYKLSLTNSSRNEQAFNVPLRPGGANIQKDMHTGPLSAFNNACVQSTLLAQPTQSAGKSGSDEWMQALFRKGVHIVAFHSRAFF
jgi:hypothetical protein